MRLAFSCDHTAHTLNTREGGEKMDLEMLGKLIDLMSKVMDMMGGMNGGGDKDGGGGGSLGSLGS